MKHLIIKTVIISLSLIIAISFIIIGLVSVISPITIANASYRLGNYTISVKYTEKQYEKTKSFEDLALLVERSIWAKDYNYTVKYSPIFLNSLGFENYCKDKDGYENYIVCYYVESLYLTGNKEKSIEISFSYYDGISDLNPIRVLVLASKNDFETLNKISKRLNEIENKTQETTNLINQINNLKGAING